MFHALVRHGTARQPVARLEQRRVEGFAVVRDQDVKALEHRLYFFKYVRLFIEVAHEELMDQESRAIHFANADQEGVGSRSSRKSRRLGIEECPARWRCGNTKSGS